MLPPFIRSNLTRHEYDAAGNLEAIVRTDGTYESWTYDTKGNPITWRNRRGQQMHFAYDQLGHQQSYFYDTVGRLDRMTDEAGSNIVEYAYDTRGRRVGMDTHYGAWIYQYEDIDQLMLLTNSARTSIGPHALWSRSGSGVNA